MHDNILSIRNLKKIYHNKDGETIAIDDLNLDIKDTEILAIVGPSGCGKSTLLSILANLELSDFKDKYPSNLSGGMKQRVALIRTLATNPDILLLDEPYSALDYQTRLALSNDLYKIIKEEGKTVIMITHDIAEAISMADRIVVLTKRPCRVKKIYDVKLSNKGLPIENRKAPEFSYYYDMIWRDLDVHL